MGFLHSDSFLNEHIKAELYADTEKQSGLRVKL